MLCKAVRCSEYIRWTLVNVRIESGLRVMGLCDLAGPEELSLVQKVAPP